MFVEIRDDVLWLKQLKDAPDLFEAASRLPAGEVLTLRVDGIVGKWARMRQGRDGRPTKGLKPIGAMAEVWARLQRRRGELVTLEWPGAEDDPLLRLADETFDEWRSAEDEAAYGELRPL